MKRKPKKKTPTRRRAAGPSGIGDVLESLKKTSKLGKQLEQAAIWERWEEIVGPKLSRHGRPRTVKDARLIVDVDSSVSMHAFAYRKYYIMRRINGFAGKELVSDIYFKLAPDAEDTPLQNDDPIDD